MTDTTAAESKPGGERRSRLAHVICRRDPDTAWPAPRAFGRTEVPNSIKAVQMCPAVLDYENRVIEIPCPIDITLRLDAGKRALASVDEDAELPEDMLAIDWSDPKRPRLRAEMPYALVAEEELYVTLLPPYLHFQASLTPGLVVSSRHGIGNEPFRLVWTFDWLQIDRKLVLRQADPLLYLRFETVDPSRPVRMTLD